MESGFWIAICDDEDFFNEQLYKCLEKKLRDVPCRFICVKSGAGLIQLCKSRKIDAVFLDIAMPGISGFETARQLRLIRDDMILIFVSSMENMVYSSYEYQPFWFIPKSQMWLLDRAVENMIKRLTQKQWKDRPVQLRLETKVVEIDTGNIEYFYTEGHYIKFVERSGRVSDSYRCKLGIVEEQLKDCGFIRTHKRFLVNMKCVCSISKNMLELHGGSTVPVSRSNMAAVKRKFQEYLRSI